MDDNRCAKCGEHSVSERVVPISVEHSGKSVVVQDRQNFCASCESVSYRGSQISEHEIKIGDAIREMDGLLSAKELQRIRSKYRLRQTDLEQMLSIGPKSWTRWERGKIPQSKAADTLIRVIAEDADVAKRLMESAGIDNPAAASVFAQIEEDAKRLTRAALREELGLLRHADAEQFANRIADRAFETIQIVRRQATAEAEAA